MVVMKATRLVGALGVGDMDIMEKCPTDHHDVRATAPSETRPSTS